MSSFSVNTKELKANARTFLECSQELRRYGAEIESIKSELDPSCAVVIPCLEEIERQTQ